MDRPLVDDAYRAYAYFRWVDDHIDQDRLTRPQRLAFVARQREIVASTYRGRQLAGLSAEEQMVVDLIENDGRQSSGLRAYIDNMMAVMAFDAGRRGRTISGQELEAYTQWLAISVTEALHHFIGHGSASPQDRSRYLPTAAAHVTHMLRDTIEDVAAGYYNIPQEYLSARGLHPATLTSDQVMEWVRDRVKLARRQFQASRAYLAQVESMRCRIAGYAYIARFEVVLDAIERDAYRLRPEYPERKNRRSAMKMVWASLSQAFRPVAPMPLAGLPVSKETI